MLWTLQQDQIYWSQGIVELGELSGATIGYTAGYVTKKLTSPTDIRLAGRPPEFSVMSLRPGLGHVFALRYIRELTGALGGRVRPIDIPATFRHNGTEYVFGRHLRNVMRMWCGFLPKTPQEEWDEYLKSYSTLLGS